VSAACDAAIAGHGGGLGLITEPGHGGTSLLADAVAHARTLSPAPRVVEIRAHEAERHVAWAGVSQLVVSLRDRLAQIDDLPAGTLRAALGWQEASTVSLGSSAAVAMSLLALIVDAADDTPTVIAIDDAHWLDPASLGAIGFVVRRLRDAPAVVLAVARPGSAAATEFAESVRVGPLPDTAARQLLASIGIRDSTVAGRLIEACGGNPGALTEFGRSLTAAQRAGSASLPAPLVIGQAFVDVIIGRVEALPGTTRAALLDLAAADVEGDAPAADGPAETTGPAAPSSLVEAAIAAGLVQVSGGAVEFVSPGVRSAVYWGATDAERRAAHCALAERMPPEDPRRTWHLAAVATEPDAALAAAVAAIAAGQQLRGAAASAASSFVRAAELDPDPAGRRRWHLAAITSALAADRVALAASLLDLLEPVDPGDGPDAVAAEMLRARVQVLAGDQATARDRYRAIAADDRVDTVQRGAAAVAAVGLSLRMYDVADAVSATFYDCDDDAVQRRTEILRGAIAQFTGGSGEGFQRYRELLTADASHDDLSFLAEVVAWLLGLSGQTEATLALLEHVHGEAARRGWMQPLPGLLLGRAMLLGRSDLKAASAAAQQSLDLAYEMGIAATSIFAIGALSNAAAGLGEERAIELSQRLIATGTDAGRIGGVMAIGFLHMTYERHAEVVASYRPLYEWTISGQGRSGMIWQADLAEAAWRLGDHELAHDAAKQLSELARETPTAWLRGADERITALFAASDDFSDHFARSVDAFDAEGLAVAKARSLLLWGERLRRARRRSDAQVRLRAARELFAAAGMEVWAARCDRELAAGGLRTADSAGRTASELLTVQELQVARWIVAGESYRAVADRLFISPRTVEGHLAAVYRKLGVAGRKGLAAKALDDPSLLRAGA